MSGCMRLAAAIWWGGITLIFDVCAGLILVGVIEGDADQQASNTAVFFFMVLFLLPFNLIGIGLWRTVLRDRRLARCPTGMARVQPTATGWQAELPDDQGPLAGAFVAGGLSVLSVFGLLGLFRALPPVWASAVALGVDVTCAGWAYRRWKYRPLVLVDRQAQTLTLPMGRGQPAQTVDWQAVKWILLVEPEQSSVATPRPQPKKSANRKAGRTRLERWITRLDDRLQAVDSVDEDSASSRYDVSLKLEGKGGTRFVTLCGVGQREPVARFVAWLSQHIGSEITAR